MIKLHLAIYTGDALELDFKDNKELVEYMKKLKAFKGTVWVASGGDYPNMEVTVTESVDLIKSMLNKGLFPMAKDKDENQLFFIQEYPNFRAAYSVAFDMRGENPLQGN